MIMMQIMNQEDQIQKNFEFYQSARKMLKKIIKNIIISINSLISKTKSGRFFNEQIIKILMESYKSVIYKQTAMKFSAPNTLNHFRINTFSDKEPETLDWIDSLPKNSVLWDIGANIGLYSVYAAKSRNCDVIAFEPSVFNLELLARNINLNDLQKKISIMPIALTDKLGPNSMKLTSKEWGGALSTFGRDLSWDGGKIDDIFSYSIFGCSMDQAINILRLPKPDFIKIDVDGIEHFILKGGRNILKNIRGILIEINDNFHEQSFTANDVLSKSGLVLDKKLQGDMLKDSKYGFDKTFNQIWIRNKK